MKEQVRISQDDDLEVLPSKSPLELEIQAYRDFPTRQDEQVNDEPEIFWVVNEGKFPLLSRLALNLLAILVASAAPGKVSLIATVASMGKANKLSGRNLERKVLPFRNTEFLPGLD